MKSIIAALALLIPCIAQAASYDITCTATCAVDTLGDTAPAGSILNVIQWCGSQAQCPYTPTDAAGNASDVTLTADEGGKIYQPPAPSLTPAQIAANLIAGGVTVTSTSTPALDGVYGMDAATTANINAISTFVLVNAAFPTGASQVFLDLSGEPHVFSSTTEWQAFASAVAKTVALVDLYGAGGGAQPSTSVTIP